MPLSPPPRPGWIDYVWLFRLLLELPASTGGRGGGTCLPNLPKYLQQQSCPGQPSAVPSREDKLSVLWQHIFQHFQLEQACEEASHRLITSRLLTHVEKIYMLHCASLFFLYEILTVQTRCISPFLSNIISTIISTGKCLVFCKLRNRSYYLT